MRGERERMRGNNEVHIRIIENDRRQLGLACEFFKGFYDPYKVCESLQYTQVRQLSSHSPERLVMRTTLFRVDEVEIKMLY